MGRLSCWLAPPILVLSAVAVLAADARSQPSADELIDAILVQESMIESVKSIYLRFEGKLTPDDVARNLAELKKQFPGVPVDAKKNTSLGLETTEELELAFDERRARTLDYRYHDHWFLSVFNGERTICDLKYLNVAPADREHYVLNASPRRVFEDPFEVIEFVWLRIGVHPLWFSGRRTPDQIRARNETLKTYRLSGQAEFRGRQCYVLDSALSSRRFHVGIDDGRLYGSTELRLPAGTDVLPAVSKAAGRNFNSLDEYRHWEKGLTAAEVQAFYERFVVERFPQLKPEDVSYLDDYREIAPGFWFPAVQGYLLASGDIGRAIRLVESKVDQPLADSLFVIDLKDGIEVTDCSYDPPLFYKQKADRTPEEWQGILGKHKRQADEWKAEIAARDAWIGRPAPELPKSAWVNSEPLSLASLKGRVVLLDFWATDCGGCRSELLAAESMYRDAKDNGIIVIGVHASGTGRDEVEAFAKQMKLTYPIAIDGPPPEGVIVFGELSGRLGVRSIPYSFVIDQQGKVVAHGGNVGKALESAYALVRKPRE